MRRILTLLHRWVGLCIAAFLFVAGLTGAVISWDHELDEWLNPHLTEARAPGPALPALDLARQVEARDPRVAAIHVPLAAEPGHSLSLFVLPRVDPATGRLFEPGYNQIFLDPATGEELGRRQWGQAWPITSETLISFLYKLHYSLHIPEIWGIDRWGIWLMGGIAIAWTLDCFVGLLLTLPGRRATGGRGFLARWAPAWKVKAGGSAYRTTFDIHRAFSLWTWALLLVLAFTAFSLNLYREVFLPVMSQVSTLSPTPFSERSPAALHAPVAPRLTREEAVAIGAAEAERRGWAEPPGSVSYALQYGVYTLRFFQPGDDHGAAGVGPAAIYLDGQDGRVLGELKPWHGTAADIFVQAQFPVHSGRILGVPGRIIISVMGLVVAVLSVTGVVIWWRKQAARRAVERRRALAGAAPLPAE
ncbi:PepSY-associated TM helix domain-containing protein [Belnapia moabensis]|uniref:PepSY-associated TM helix domain-containing protein n=1 Tax=Belnapia moabensis TaxID=365533 RepID=UPI0005BB2CA5|nr:PepSY-associated TM helix domain-containing protein [Belnapia moabensis]